MLFSNDEIARSINETFEPAWQSVRDVPLVRIDFGKGNVLTRTLNGNIATYVCTADGKVLDVLPGIYEPQTYKDQLAQLVLLHSWVRPVFWPPQRDDESPDEKLARYHRTQSAALARGDSPHVIVREREKRGNRTDYTKIAVIERPLKLVLKAATAQVATNHSGGTVAAAGSVAGAVANHAGGLPGGYPGYVGSQQSPNPNAAASMKSEKPPALLAALVNDTKLNETARRGKIHERLAKSGPVTPAELTKWLYREVLDTDLDDPYLGLGETLFTTYPFKEEDQLPNDE